MSIVLIGTNIRTWRERERDRYIYIYIYIYTRLYTCAYGYFSVGTKSDVRIHEFGLTIIHGISNQEMFLAFFLWTWLPRARLARRSLCLWLHSFWFLNVPQKYIAFPLTALQKFRSWCFSPKLNLSRELCELWCRRCRAIKANPKSQCMGLSLICSGYPMSGSKGPHHGPKSSLLTLIIYIYIYCIHLWHLRHPTVGCWKDSGKHRGPARRLWPPRRLGPSHHILLSGCSRSVALSHPGIPWHHMAPSFARTSHLHQSFSIEGWHYSWEAQTASDQRMFCVKYCNGVYFVYCMIQKSRKRVEGCWGASLTLL